jgi:hypothetical protein
VYISKGKSKTYYTTYFRDTSAPVITDNGAALKGSDYSFLSPVSTTLRRRIRYTARTVRSCMERNSPIAINLGNIFGPFYWG